MLQRAAAVTREELATDFAQRYMARRLDIYVAADRRLRNRIKAIRAAAAEWTVAEILEREG